MSFDYVVGFLGTVDRIGRWVWEGVRGLVSGAVFFMMPGLAPALVAGPLVAWIVAGRGGAISAALFGRDAEDMARV